MCNVLISGHKFLDRVFSTKTQKERDFWLGGLSEFSLNYYCLTLRNRVEALRFAIFFFWLFDFLRDNASNYKLSKGKMEFSLCVVSLKLFNLSESSSPILFLNGHIERKILKDVWHPGVAKVGWQRALSRSLDVSFHCCSFYGGQLDGVYQNVCRDSLYPCNLSLEFILRRSLNKWKPNIYIKIFIVAWLKI